MESGEEWRLEVEGEGDWDEGCRSSARQNQSESLAFPLLAPA